MANSTATPAGTTQRTQTVRNLVESTTVNFIAWILTSVLAGSSAAYVMSTADIDRIRTELDRVIQGTEGRINLRLNALESRQNAIVEDIRRTKSEMTEAERQLSDEISGVTIDLSRATTEREWLMNRVDLVRDKAQEHFMTLDGKLIDTSQKIVATERAIAERQAAIHDEIKALSDQLSSYHRAFIDELAKLAEEGRRIVGNKTVIENKHMAEARAWIAKANYMIRSLAIPTEAGWLRDTSAVKEDLRKAMEGFEQCDGRARMQRARRVLMIVEAIRSLAEGGRIP